MRVLWVQDLEILPAFGGAQATDLAHVGYGFKLGHEIDLLTLRAGGVAADVKIDAADLVVVSNCVTFPQSVLEYIMQRKRYVMFSHDYWFCRWRGYNPLQEQCFKCMRLPRWRELYKRSILNIFLSPLHFEMHATLIPELKDHPHKEIPSPIDVNMFKPVAGVERKPNSVLYLGPFAEYKGIRYALAYTTVKPEYEYTFCGQDAGGIEQPWRDKILQMGHKVLPPLPNEVLPELYSKYEFFLELPMGPLPFERTVAEAYLAGCRLILNRNVGFASWEFKDREECRKAVSESKDLFWRAIEDAMQVLR